ncbi:LacI family DNA-binding transcriptional regulator [Curtobacterium sp. MCSS17_015]|uniref:LacI family DNA-binding transcriptional regulator n=1 Tax=Curtobacterium sp. MCSS17_015 TaxID=2175666 RepID=UPI0011B4BB4A|nr:LacI family DNA-binding transcriptional regulator [Curtobacterium sp. MCSS17_015]WIB26551.1 LacI family DNA-binding transcriptional regulator [Curtobacterium sp. MCSS17_015]
MDDTASDLGASGTRPDADRAARPGDAAGAGGAARRPDAAEVTRASRSGRAARPTLAAVARAAGVAPSTASLAFSGSGPVSEDTRQRILAVAAELGYDGPDPRARSLRRGRSGVIGVVLDDRLSDAFRDPVNVLTLDGIAEVAGAAGVSLLLVRSPLDDERGMAPLVDAPMDAVILIGCNVRIDPAVAVLRRRSIPVVAIEADTIEGAVPVHLDNREASRRAAAYLRDLGHEQVTVVTLPLDSARERGPVDPDRERLSSAFTTTERLRGVRGVYPDAPAIATAGSSVEEGRIAGAALFAPGVEPPTAVVAQSDLLAVGVISAALEAGLRVPEDVSVVGFDGIQVDDSLLHRSPIRQLTTLVQPFVPKGEAAARAALAMLEGESPEPASFRSELRIGDTTAAPRG